MRVYVGVAIALVAALALGFITLQNLSSTADRIVDGFEGLDSNIAAGNWDEAGAKIEKVKSIWDKQKGRWAMIVDHQEIDNIDMALARIGKYVDMRDPSLASGELAVLRQMLEHIPEKEAVKLKNIF